MDLFSQVPIHHISIQFCSVDHSSARFLSVLIPSVLFGLFTLILSVSYVFLSVQYHSALFTIIQSIPIKRCRLLLSRVSIRSYSFNPILLCSVSFNQVPTYIPFCSVPFCSVPFLSVQCHFALLKFVQ